MQLFYAPHIDHTTTQFTFEKEEGHHIVKVLRKTEGDLLHITDGRGGVFTASISTAHAKKCEVIITDYQHTPGRKYYLHMAVAPTKANDRYEWFLEKAVELGVDEITPIFCSHSERKQVKPERFEKILISAMKQSLQYHLPRLNAAISFQDFIRMPFDGQLFIAHCENSKRFSLQKKAMAHRRATVLIGPEGDFSKDEIHTSLKKGFIPVSLGHARLRTETAAIAACHTLVLVNEND